MQNYQNYYYQNTTPPPYPVYPPVKPPLSPKQQQRRTLRRTSNGLGFFVLAYFLVMQQLALLLCTVFSDLYTSSGTSHKIFWFLLEIVVSTGSSFLAVIVYRSIVKRRYSDNFSQTRLKADMLVPMVMVGMGAAMVANQLAALFDQNISLFELKNTVTMTSETQSVPEIILYIISTALVPALAEELAFRGVFMNIMRKYGDSFAIITSSVLFGAMHGNTTQIIFAFTLGLIFAYMDCKANSIIPSIIIHFANNFYAVTTDIIGNNLGVDDTTVAVIRIIIILAFSLLALLSYIYLANRDKNFFRLSENDESEYAVKSLMTLKEKFIACFTTAGMIVSLTVFIGEMLLNLIPQESITQFVRSITGG